MKFTSDLKVDISTGYLSDKSIEDVFNLHKERITNELKKIRVNPGDKIHIEYDLHIKNNPTIQDAAEVIPTVTDQYSKYGTIHSIYTHMVNNSEYGIKVWFLNPPKECIPVSNIIKDIKVSWSFITNLK